MVEAERGFVLTLAEVQQTSDTTFFLYDYGRPRTLNLERALAVADGIHCASRYRRSIAQGPILVDGPYFRLDQIAGEPSLETCTSCPGGLLALPLEGEVFSKAGSTRAQAGACLHACSIDALDFYRRSNPCL